jgi:hypothetical protein
LTHNRTAAQPADVDVGAVGSAVVIDQMNNQVRRIAAWNVATTLAGSTTPDLMDGIDALASSTYPFGITLGTNGDNLCRRSKQ